MYILGITVGHNGSVTLMKDTQIVFHIEEERISRLKRDSEPLVALNAILDYTNVIDLLVLSGTSHCKLTEYTAKSYQEAYLNKIGIHVTETIDEGAYHHRLHAYNAFLNSGYEESIVLTIDGAGSSHEEGDRVFYEAETVSYMDKGVEGEGVYDVLYTNLISNEETDLEDETFRISDRPTIVKMFEAVTERIGYPVEEAGKTMGLSAYGLPNEDIKPLLEGSRGNEFFKPYYPAKSSLDTEVYGEFDGEIGQYEMDLALMVQEASQEVCNKLVAKALKLKPECTNICISGGYGLNVLNNYQLVKSFPQINFWFEPTCNDAGNSIGAARMHSFLKFREASPVLDYCLGHSYEISTKALQGDFKVKGVSPKDIARLIAENNIVAIYQGRSEAGPRALGNRSFMYHPGDPDGKDKMNLVKKREGFRPFAASVLQEHASDYFEMCGVSKSPYMMVAFPTKWDKLNAIPAVVHEDGSTRIQTVGVAEGGKYRDVIESFYDITGIPMVMNTSFNLAGEPLVETPKDALNTLANADFNYLYFADAGIMVYKEKE